MTSANEPPEPQEAARVADEVSGRLREAGFPERAVTAWWMLLVDPNLQQTAYRVWKSGDYATLWTFVDRTVGNIAAYRRALEEVISDHFAEQLSQSDEVRARLLGSAL